MYQPSTDAVSAVVNTTATPPPAMPSAGNGPEAEDQAGRQRHQQHDADADRQRRHQHVAGAADDAGQRVHQPDQHGAGEHHVGIAQRRVERAALAAQRAIERRAEQQDQRREGQAQRRR